MVLRVQSAASGRPPIPDERAQAMPEWVRSSATKGEAMVYHGAPAKTSKARKALNLKRCQVLFGCSLVDKEKSSTNQIRPKHLTLESNKTQTPHFRIK